MEDCGGYSAFCSFYLPHMPSKNPLHLKYNGFLLNKKQTI